MPLPNGGGGGVVVLSAAQRPQVTREWNMASLNRIETNPKVMLGKPVIRGTRIPVELLLRKLSEGAAHTELLDAYPNLTQEDIHAALAYAAGVLAHEEVVEAEPTKG